MISTARLLLFYSNFSFALHLSHNFSLFCLHEFFCTSFAACGVHFRVRASVAVMIVLFTIGGNNVCICLSVCVCFCCTSPLWRLKTISTTRSTPRINVLYLHSHRYWNVAVYAETSQRNDKQWAMHDLLTALSLELRQWIVRFSFARCVYWKQPTTKKYHQQKT